MGYSNEIDWIAAWYEVSASWDTTISFWMTATFAVIVATHALGERVTLSLTRLLACLYGAFSLYTALRLWSTTEEGLYIFEQLQAANLMLKPADYLDSSNVYQDVVLWLIIGLGSIATVYFVFSAPRRYGTISRSERDQASTPPPPS